MSFCGKLKTELCNLKTPECCRIAECYGIMLFGRFFSSDKIGIQTENEAVAQNFCYLLRKCFGIYETPVSSNGKRPVHKVYVNNSDDRKKILESLGNEDILYTDILSKDCCRASFIRGVFLSCGQCNEPEKNPRIDLIIKNEALVPTVIGLLNDAEIEPNMTVRSGKNVIYLKKSETVEDFITIMGAGNITLELMDLKIIKEVRNNINRRNNAEEANTAKMIEASIKQRNAISYLIKKEKFDILPEELQEVALLRMANKEATLSELCKLSSFPLTRSGLNHRLKRILEVAEKYGFKGEIK